MRNIVMCFVLLFSLYCLASEDRPVSVKSLNNSDVKWDAFGPGIFPRMSERSKKVLSEISANDVDVLIAMLGDIERFVVAHVILAEIFAVEAEIHSDSFFDLKVILNRKGEPSYTNYKPDVLSDYWRNVRKTKKLDLPSERRKSQSK